ncbi:MAG: aspartyl/glutamyl-tRNA amidotransferase subunit C [Firmicutes bacterium]|nr:aspartyl/glutamyl-tRNA amidotransferase subunit C [Bacillota bacterium]
MDIQSLRQFAQNAKIGLSGDEEAVVFDNLSRIFSELDRVKAATCADEPLITVCDLPGVTREDEAQKFIPRDELLTNAVEERNGYFVVPKTLD